MRELFALAAPQGTPRAPRYETLDAWRGLACLVVIVFHAASYAAAPEAVPDTRTPEGLALFALRWMWAGVPMFFVISGYCIAATADSARRSGRGLGDFFVRRFRRIFPPYWVLWMLCALAVTVAPAAFPRRHLAIHPPWDLSAAQVLGNLTLTELWRPHVWGGPARFTLEHAWTLSYEEQFYVVCGLLLLVARRGFFAGVCVAALATLALAPWSFKDVGLKVDGFFYDGSFLLFAAGVTLYLRRNYATPAAERVLDGLLVAGAVGAFLFRRHALAHFVLGDFERLLADQFLLGSAFAVVLAATQRFDARSAAWPVARALRGCGRMCYSLYLVHYPIASVVTAALAERGVRGLGPVVLVAVPAVLALSLVAGRVFHLSVERRFLNPPARAAAA